MGTGSSDAARAQGEGPGNPPGEETPGELDLDRRPRESAHGRARTHFREGSEARPVPWSGQVCTAECAPGRRSGPRPAPLGLRLLRPDQQAGGRQPSASLRVRGRAGLAQPLAALVRARGGSRVPHSAAAARPMAPQRRGAPKGPEGCGAAERGRPNRYRAAGGSARAARGSGQGGGAGPSRRVVGGAFPGTSRRRGCGLTAGAWHVLERTGSREGRGLAGGRGLPVGGPSLTAFRVCIAGSTPRLLDGDSGREAPLVWSLGFP